MPGRSTVRASPRSWTVLGLFAVVLVVSLGFAVADEEKGIHLPVKPTYSIPIEGDVEGLLVTNVDDDEYLDILVAVNPGGRKGQSMLFLSREGKFKRPAWISRKDGVWAGIDLGDLDGDGKADIVIVTYNHHHSAAYRGLGKGRFEFTPFWKTEATDWASGVHIGDFDGDGFADIFARGYTNHHLIYRGTKDGPQGTYDWVIEPSSWASESVWTDVDGDGRNDIVIVNRNGPAYVVYRGREKDFEKVPGYEATVKGGCSGIALGDVDGDGFQEIATGAMTSRLGDGRLRLFGNEGGTPTKEPIWIGEDLDCYSTSLSFYDFDGDRDLDLFVLAGDHTGIYENQKGSLATSPCWRADISGWTARVADLDSNGYPDLIIGGDDALLFYHGDRDQQCQVVPPLPSPPQLPPLTPEDLPPDMGRKIAYAVKVLLKTESQSERDDVTEFLRKNAPEELGFMEAIGEPNDVAGEGSLEPVLNERVAELVGQLGDDRQGYRERAIRLLEKCGRHALPILKAAVVGDDLEARELAKEPYVRARANLRMARLKGIPAIEVWGLCMAELTPHLAERYGWKAETGVVVLATPENVAWTLGIGNIREGDLILGVGPMVEYGEKVDPVRTPQDFPRLLVHHCESAGIRLVGLQWKCGPNHPMDRGELHTDRLDLSASEWAMVQRVLTHPQAWRPKEP